MEATQAMQTRALDRHLRRHPEAKEAAPPAGTPEGETWLQETLLRYLRKHPGSDEVKILRFVEAKTLEEHDQDHSFRAVDLLFEMVKAGSLRWDEQPGKPDAPLRYWVT